MSIKRFAVSVGLACAWCVTLLAVQRGVEAAEPDVNLVLTKGPRLERLSVSLKMDGRPAGQLWDDNFAALVEFFDRDGNGLTQREAERLPSAIALREVLGLAFVPQLGGVVVALPNIRQRALPDARAPI